MSNTLALGFLPTAGYRPEQVDDVLHAHIANGGGAYLVAVDT